MNTSILNFTFVKTPKTKYSDEQVILQEFTGRSFTRSEAALIWSKILKHKSDIHRNLRRDAGLKVAAIDFIENFYTPETVSPETTEKSVTFGEILGKIENFFRSFFKAKGKTLSY